MGKLIPIILALIGLGGGVGAGLALRPPAEIVEINPCGDTEPVVASTEVEADEEDPSSEFVKINNQFIIPVIHKDEVGSLVVISLNVEVSAGGRETVYKREPKLRDEFLQVMFNHANNGGFEGTFTHASRLEDLRIALRQVAKAILGDVVKDVLVTNIVRQDIQR